MMKSKLIAAIMASCLLIPLFGCSQAKKSVVNKYALETVKILDNEYNTNLKTPPAADVISAAYCASAGASSATAVKSTELAVEGLRKAVGDDPEGMALADKVDKLRLTLKECSFVRCKASVRGDTAPVENIAKLLGIDPAAQPSQQACASYEKMSAKLNAALAK